MIRNWKETPGKLALFLGMFASVVIAIWIHSAFFSGSDERLELIFVASAVMATTYAHFLNYRREMLRSLREESLALVIIVAGFGAGIWISFAYFDGGSFLSSLPIIIGLFVAWGVVYLNHKWFRKA